MKLATALSASAATLALASLRDAVSFHYRSRNDPSVRQLVRKQSKMSSKAAKREKKVAEQQETLMIEKAVRDVAEPGTLPEGIQEKESLYVLFDRTG